jgi:hypothetical protein
MKLKIAGVAAAALALTACDNAQVTTTLDPSKLTYARDARTNLCFAVIGRANSAVAVIQRAHSLSITQVPCTTEVLELIRRG